MNILVTGGLGFIGSNFIRTIINKDSISSIVNIDCPSKLSAAANINNAKDFKDNPKYHFYDFWLDHLEDPQTFKKFIQVLKDHKISHIIHFAAETHVDNSISNPRDFLRSNIIGTFNLLELCKQENLRIHLISTDEVYGSLGHEGKFSETSCYAPNSPYSASKASADMLARAYYHTFKVPITISNCSNNYGPYQHNEKFIPVVINSLLNNQKIPVYGTGKNIRDWIYVIDHCEAVFEIVKNGKIGETYNIGGDCEKTNLEIISNICKILQVNPEDYIKFVEDRKGHDFRYAIDNTKINKELNWYPKTDFLHGLEKTIEFYKNRY
jgi:dTDP-glucose 4,6-dehydratase